MVILHDKEVLRKYAQSIVIGKVQDQEVTLAIKELSSCVERLAQAVRNGIWELFLVQFVGHEVIIVLRGLTRS